MSRGWHSKKYMRGGKHREPALGEYFTTEGIGDQATEALVREAIQNSLDAAIPPGPVRVRFFVSGTEGALPAIEAEKWTMNLWPHLSAPRSGLSDLPLPTESCPFVTVEDFGTTGLVGDPNQDRPFEDPENSWYFFFRKEGDSSKSKTDRGRWGIGKVVFPLASRVRTFFVLTQREGEPEPLVMGQSMLRSREVAGDIFEPDVWFCEQAADGFELPIKDPDSTKELVAAFRLKRAGEPGLSIAIPYADSDISAQGISLAAVRGFFLPILTGDLEIIVETPTASILIDRQLLATERGRAQATEGDPSVAATVALAHWYVNAARSVPAAAMHEVNGALRWKPELVSDDLRDSLRETLTKGDPLAIRIPMTISPKSGSRVTSHIDVVLQRTSEDNAGRTVFIRQGLIIPDVRASRTPGIRSLVIAEHPGVATMLGDSENPAHNQWQSGSSHFKAKYKFGPSHINYVKESAANVVRRILDKDSAEDRTALLNFFSLPAPSDDPEAVTSRRRVPATAAGGVPPPTPDIPTGPKRPFSISRIAGGFVLRSVDGLPQPRLIAVNVAYDMRGGNPLKNYYEEDFDFADLKLEVTGAEIRAREGNRLLVAPGHAPYRVQVTGFDDIRDLYISAKAEEVHDDSQD